MLQEIENVMRACGEIMLRADRTQAGVQNKGRYNDLVTRYDKQIQEILRARLLEMAPDAKFVGEEEDVHADIAKGRAFIVDPIDGTLNFVRDYRCSVISVAMTQDGALVLGMIYNPYVDEMYIAEKGKGAFCNGRPIHVSDRPLHAGVAFYGSASYYREKMEASLRLLRACTEEAMDIRRSGSAAWDLCTVASGRAELYFELKLQPWDYAAGTLLVQEAGGQVLRAEGGDVTLDAPCSVVAVGSGVDPAFLRKFL